MPNAPFNLPGSLSGDSATVVACPNARNYISVLGFRLSAAGTNTAEWDSSPLSGEWTFLQGNSATAGPPVVSLAVTYENEVTKGDLLLAYTLSYGVGNSCTVTDSQGNTWTPVSSVSYKTSLYNGEMWQTTASASGQNTVTMTPATPGLQAIVVVEMLPPSGTPSADASNQDTGTGATMTTLPVTVSGPGELLCGFFNDSFNGPGTPTYTPGAGEILGFSAANFFGTFLFVYNPSKSSSGALTVSVTGGTPNWGAVGASFTNTGLTTQDGPYQLGTGSPVCVPQNDQQPVFDLPPGTDLVLTTTANNAVSGGVTYALRQVAGGGPFN